jgi:hypothetical protein
MPRCRAGALACVVLAGLTAAALHAGARQPAAGGGRCAAQVAAQRARWEASDPPIVQPPTTPGGLLRHWPTGPLGVWLVEDISATHASLTRVSGGQVTRITWSSDCQPTSDTQVRPAAPPPAFTDNDLSRLLARGQPAVLYLWSPHMPLSVDGYAQLVTAAGPRGLAVEPLLDAAADRRFADTSRTPGGLPESALRVVDSVELQFRELPLHAPAIAVISRGRLVGPVLRGYRTAAEYGAFFDRVLPAP